MHIVVEAGKILLWSSHHLAFTLPLCESIPSNRHVAQYGSNGSVHSGSRSSRYIYIYIYSFLNTRSSYESTWGRLRLKFRRTHTKTIVCEVLPTTSPSILHKNIQKSVPGGPATYIIGIQSGGNSSRLADVAEKLAGDIDTWRRLIQQGSASFRNTRRVR